MMSALIGELSRHMHTNLAYTSSGFCRIGLHSADRVSAHSNVLHRWHTMLCIGVKHERMDDQSRFQNSKFAFSISQSDTGIGHQARNPFRVIFCSDIWAGMAQTDKDDGSISLGDKLFQWMIVKSSTLQSKAKLQELNLVTFDNRSRWYVHILAYALRSKACMREEHVAREREN